MANVNVAAHRLRKKILRNGCLKLLRMLINYLKVLDKLEWPEKVKAMQRNWIGKSEGVEIFFKATSNTGKTLDLPIFTKFPETIYGTTFLVIAPNHPLINDLVSAEDKEAVEEYRDMVMTTRMMGE